MVLHFKQHHGLMCDKSHGGDLSPLCVVSGAGYHLWPPGWQNHLWVNSVKLGNLSVSSELASFLCFCDLKVQLRGNALRTRSDTTLLELIGEPDLASVLSGQVS